MEVNIVYDLVVVGAGPAGSVAAISAARSGAKVLLLESGKFPRQKVCGEFVSAEALQLLAETLSPQHQGLIRNALRLHRARLFLDGEIIETSVTPPGASIARIDLDAALWDSARESGVEAIERCSVRSVTRVEPEIFHTKTTQKVLISRSVIDASGRWSTLSSAALAGDPDRPSHAQRWMGIKAHFSEEAPEMSTDLYFFDGGYCGVQPVQMAGEKQVGRLNASAVVKAGSAKSLQEVFIRSEALARRAKNWKPLIQELTTFPLIFGSPEPERDGVLRVGDAAAFVDPFVGDGISLATRSGALAAACLSPFLSRRKTLRQATADYRESYRVWLSPVFRSSSQVRRLLRLPRPVRRPLIFAFQKAPALTNYFVSATR